MLLLLRVLTIVIICIMAYLSTSLIKYREYRTQLPDLSLARADLSMSLPYWCSFIGFLYLIVLCSSFGVFKLLLLVYKSVNGLCPSYVADLLKIRSSSISLRSSSMDYLVQPVSKTKTYGERAFSVYAPKLWNSIPLSIRNYKSSSITIFEKNIKTFLFSKFVTSNSLLFN